MTDLHAEDASHPQVRISRASADDLPAILDLQHRAYLPEAERYGDWDIPPLTQTLDDIRNEFTVAVFLKAQAGGVLVGSVRGRLIGGRCHVGRLIVEPRHQGHGIGSRLLVAIESEFAGAEGFTLFTGAASDRNIQLYERHGYRVEHSSEQSERVTLVHLSKPGARSR